MASFKYPSMNSANAAARDIYRIAGWGAVVSVLLIPVQLLFFVTWVEPTDALGHLTLAERSPVLSLVSFDFLEVVKAICVLLMYIGFYFALRPSAAVVVSVVLGAVGIAAYLASNMSVDMGQLVGQGAGLLPKAAPMAPGIDMPGAMATGQGAASAQALGALKGKLLAGTKVLLAHQHGTGFTVYHILTGVTFFLIGKTMLASSFFSRSTGLLGMAAGLCFVIPPTWGKVGFISSLVVLFPWVGFGLLTAKQLFRSAALIEVVAQQNVGSN